MTELVERLAEMKITDRRAELREEDIQVATLIQERLGEIVFTCDDEEDNLFEWIDGAVGRPIRRRRRGLNIPTEAIAFANIHATPTAQFFVGGDSVLEWLAATFRQISEFIPLTHASEAATETFVLTRGGVQHRFILTPGGEIPSGSPVWLLLQTLDFDE